jgi:flagellar protein FlgJ
LDALRGTASRDPRAAVREAAKQFESLFMHELLKSMRAATPTTGLMDNEATKLGTEMLDQQMATKLTGLKGGLSEAISRQLERQMGLSSVEGAAAAGAVSGVSGGSTSLGRFSAAGVSRTAAVGSRTESGATTGPGGTASVAQSFIANHRQAAQEAERRTGIPATFMIAQAAHETGWGRQDIRMPNGQPSNNLFGIKAGSEWKGPVAEITTTEYVQGVARKVTARFRAYANAAESFADYAKLMLTSPRYQEVVQTARSPESFAQGLQNAGYATDPRYAQKLHRVIQTTQRLQGGAA